jgi:hypothetical protein
MIVDYIHEYYVPECSCKSCQDYRTSIVGEKARIGVKCDICGSTAIDHTEMQCQINRQLYIPKESGRDE